MIGCDTCYYIYFIKILIIQQMDNKRDNEKKKAHSDQQQTQNIKNQQDDKKNNKPQQQQQITFGSQPISMKCPFCFHRSKTEIIMKPQLISIMFGLVLFALIPNAVMIIIIVVTLQLTATKKHRCALCQRQLGSDGKFLILFSDRVYSFRLGQNGILISKKILCTIGLFLFAIGIIFIRSRMQQSYNWIDMSWAQLVQKCPYTVKNPNCNSANFDKTVKNWKGFIMRVQDRRQSMRRFYDYAIQIYVKMDPPQRDHKTPDIYLTGSSSKLYQIYQVLQELSHGDQIMFNGTFAASRGLPGQMTNRHLHIANLNKTGNRNPSISVYMSEKQQTYFYKNVQGKSLRQQQNSTKK